MRTLVAALVVCAVPDFSLNPDDLEREFLDSGLITSDVDIRLWPECQSNTVYWAQKPEPTLTFCMNREDASNRRCEMAIHDVLMRGRPTEVSFDFKLSSAQLEDEHWVAYFQIHSFPDEGEQWRCPISALEVDRGKLLMYNRWDLKAISDTTNFTCANPPNSISQRNLIPYKPLQANEWYNFKFEANLSLNADAYSRVSLNNEQVSFTRGVNTFNDQKQPYFKLGIYKPTSWTVEDRYCVDYRNINIKTQGLGNAVN